MKKTYKNVSLEKDGDNYYIIVDKPVGELDDGDDMQMILLNKDELESLKKCLADFCGYVMY